MRVCFEHRGVKDELIIQQAVGVCAARPLEPAGILGGGGLLELERRLQTAGLPRAHGGIAEAGPPLFGRGGVGRLHRQVVAPPAPLERLRPGAWLYSHTQASLDAHGVSRGPLWLWHAVDAGYVDARSVSRIHALQ